MTYDINLPFITADATGPKHIQKNLTRAKMEQLTDSLFERTIKPLPPVSRTRASKPARLTNSCS